MTLTLNAARRSPCCETPEKEQPRGPDRLEAADAVPTGHRPPTEPDIGQEASDMMEVVEYEAPKKKKNARKQKKESHQGKKIRPPGREKKEGCRALIQE